MKSLFLSFKGRIGRKSYIIALAALALFVVSGSTILRILENNMAGFYLSLIYLTLFFWMLYAIYGKRLHDVGRSLWALSGMIFLTILIAIAVMLIYGGADYFNEFAKYDRKEDIDPAKIEQLQTEYQTRLKEGNGILGGMLWGIWIVFSLALATLRSQPKDNQYGPAPVPE